MSSLENKRISRMTMKKDATSTDHNSATGAPPRRTRSKKAKEKPRPANHKEEPGAIPELNDEVNIELFVKYEYMRLHRQYRLMENFRQKIVVQNAGVTRRKQDLDLFMREKQDLIVDIVNANAKHWQRVDKETIVRIHHILEEFEKYEIEIHHSMVDIKEMDQNVGNITKKLVEQRLKVMAIFGISMTVPQASKHRARLENRLYQRTTKFDTLVSSNRALREEVGIMLKHRGNFYTQMVEMKKQMAIGRTRMSDTCFTSTQAYDARDGYTIRTNILRERNDKECRQHVLEMKEFHRVLHHDSKRHDFMAIKNQERALLESQAQKYERRNLRRWQALGRTLTAYSSTFKQILEDSDFETMTELVIYYNSHEQENFALFQRLIETDNEVAHLRSEVVRMQQGIEQLYESHKEDQKDRHININEFTHSLRVANHELDEVLDLWAASETQMENIVMSLDAIFEVLECSNVPIIRLLGNTSGITPGNALLVIKVITERIEEFLRQDKVLEARRLIEFEGDTSNTLLKGPGTSLAPAKSKTQGGPFIPKLVVTGRLDGETDEEDDDDRTLAQRPFSYDEMKSRIKEKILISKKTSQIRQSIAMLSPSRMNSLADNESWASVIPPSFS